MFSSSHIPFQLMIPLTQESRVLISTGLCSVVQSWPALCPALDCSPPDSSVYELFQARILKWVAISFSRGSSQPKDRTWVSCVSCIAGRCFTTLPPGKPRRDVRHPPYGYPPTPVTEGEGLTGQGRAEQAATVSVSIRNSILPATSKVTQCSTGLMRMYQMGLIARQVLRPHQWVCGTNLFTKKWGCINFLLTLLWIQMQTLWWTHYVFHDLLQGAVNLILENN